MTLQIKELGGLPEGEIKLLIEDAADRREAALDTKLSAHRDEIGKRLERTEDKVDDNLNRLVDLQGSVSGLQNSFASMSEDNREQTKLLKEVVNQGREWHEDDITFRSDVQGRLSKIEIEQKSTTQQVKRLRWIGVTTNGVRKAVRFVFEKLCEADFWKLIALVLLLGLLKMLSPVMFHAVSKFVTK